MNKLIQFLLLKLSVKVLLHTLKNIDYSYERLETIGIADYCDGELGPVVYFIEKH